MKILLIHNYYQRPGGEDEVFKSEASLLRNNGQQVITFCVHNDSIQTENAIVVAAKTFWNPQAYWAIRKLCRKEQPDVMHCHNTFPLLSPSIYYAAQAENVPVIQTLHNYRLLCAGATFFRQDKICETCLNSSLMLPGLWNRCYRESLFGSGVVNGYLLFHRLIQTWKRKVTTYVALTEFSRSKFIEGGLPKEKITVKPNFITDVPDRENRANDYALFVGRLSREKGISTLLDAWKILNPQIPLKIVGDGPLRSMVQQAVERNSNIQWLGQQTGKMVLELMGQAKFLIFPSMWFECLPRTIIEAYACGTPVIASDLGSMSELIRHQQTGLLFRPGCAEDLALKVEWLINHPTESAQMRKAAKAEYNAKYTAEQNYSMLMDIYKTAKQQ